MNHSHLPLLWHSDELVYLNLLIESGDYSVRTKIDYFIRISQQVQKSELWYQRRNQFITASASAQALGYLGAFGRFQLIEEKVTQYRKSIGGKAIEWGNKYEKVAVAVYRHRYQVEVWENFGLIPSRRWPILGASPDGISGEGVMLEIKCPYSRVIKENEVKKEYYHQVQHQLAVCQLGICHFVECKFVETSPEEFWGNTSKRERGILLEVGKRGDCMVDCEDEGGSIEGSTQVVLSPIALGRDLVALRQWLEKQKNVVEVTFWEVAQFNCQIIARDPLWIKKHYPIFVDFWNEVVTYRQNKNLEDLVSRKESSRKRPVAVSKKATEFGKCLI